MFFSSIIAAATMAGSALVAAKDVYGGRTYLTVSAPGSGYDGSMLSACQANPAPSPIELFCVGFINQDYSQFIFNISSKPGEITQPNQTYGTILFNENGVLQPLQLYQYKEAKKPANQDPNVYAGFFGIGDGPVRVSVDNNTSELGLILENGRVIHKQFWICEYYYEDGFGEPTIAFVAGDGKPHDKYCVAAATIYKT